MNENQVKFLYGYDLGTIEKRAELYSQYQIDEAVVYMTSTVFLFSILSSFLATWLSFILVVLCCLGVTIFVFPKLRKKVRDNIQKKHPLSFELMSLVEADEKANTDAKGVDTDTEPS